MDSAPLIGDNVAEEHENYQERVTDDEPEECFENCSPGMFQEQLRQHFLTHSRGSSINLSFDRSNLTDISTSTSSCSGDTFREQLLSNPPQLRMYIKEKLRYHFMSPLEKWRYRRVFPWKMLFQIIKIFIVTFQILLFGVDSSQFYRKHSATETTLKTYFLEEWDSVRDIYFYPPADGPYAVYTEEELFSSINTAIRKYARVTEDPIGSFDYDSPNGTIVPPHLCLKYYNVAQVFPFNETVSFNNKVMFHCLEINPSNYSNFSIVTYLNGTDIAVDLQRLIAARLDFKLSTTYRREHPVFGRLVAYRMSFSIVYKNQLRDGLVEVNLNVTSSADLDADGKLYVAAEIARQTLNAAVIILCLVSLFLCIRSIIRCFSLLHKTVEYFRTHRQLELTFSDRFEFVDLWLCLIVLNDILVIAGTTIKMTNELNLLSRQRYLWASVLLGTGLLLVWSGVLRYLGYFRTYNVLMLTLKKSAPNLMKFVICALILFMGYSICGWIVLGPHHMKFNTLSTSLECLYAITNGDDIFATFALASDEYAGHRIPPMIWWFARVYLYSFVILFICVVINLIYAVIVDAFDTIKEESDANSHKRKSLVQEFIEERPEMASSINYLLDEEIEGRMSTFEVRKE
ncbi:mucolipin-like [Tropilaelaps mercedesae]|uniref:Mucolipin-like n=1 Tax=Tropilaelaps mercedesae TaxID=418985 RepID=A0A1V9X8L7_9ACAR|nr:mucolipin-like [Tropilaelaps mercedesae]